MQIILVAKRFSSQPAVEKRGGLSVGSSPTLKKKPLYPAVVYYRMNQSSVFTLSDLEVFFFYKIWIILILRSF